MQNWQYASRLFFLVLIVVISWRASEVDTTSSRGGRNNNLLAPKHTVSMKQTQQGGSGVARGGGGGGGGGGGNNGAGPSGQAPAATATKKGKMNQIPDLHTGYKEALALRFYKVITGEPLLQGNPQPITRRQIDAKLAEFPENLLLKKLQGLGVTVTIFKLRQLLGDSRYIHAGLMVCQPSSGWWNKEDLKQLFYGGLLTDVLRHFNVDGDTQLITTAQLASYYKDSPVVL